MDDNQIRIAQMGVRMRDFGVAEAVAFPAASTGGQKFAVLSGLVADVDEFGASQALAHGLAQSLTGAKKVGRKSLRAQMKAMRDTAKALESDHPGILMSFRIPTSNGDEALINSARAFVEVATPVKALFISHEMPVTFIEDLTAGVGQFESDVSSYNLQREKKAAATASLKDALSKIRKLRSELDPIVRNKARNNPGMLAAWESASHLERAPKRAAPSKAPVT